MIKTKQLIRCLFSSANPKNLPYIISARRTAFGKFLGRMSQLTGPQLANFAIQGTVMSANLKPGLIDEVIMNCSLTPGTKQSPTRQASLNAGLPPHIPCTTVNTSCSSSLKSIILAAKSIQLGQNGIVLAGGYQSFSNAPFYLPNHRKGLSYGHEKLQDSIVTDFFHGFDGSTPLGVYAERVVETEEIPREVQDEVAIISYERAIRAHKRNLFAEELIYLEEPQDMERQQYEDEGLNGFRREVLKQLHPIFGKNGTVTAGNSAQIADGAAAVILASEDSVNKHKIPPLARIVGYSSVAVEPERFCSSISLAIKKALESSKLQTNQIDLFELGQLFTLSTIVAVRDLEMPIDTVNVYGGCVALGYPPGAIGGKLITTVINALTISKKRFGVVAANNGTGGAEAVVVQNLRL